MSDSRSLSTSSSSYDSAVGAPQPNVVGSHSMSQGIFTAVSRHWHDVFWLLIFIVHLVVVGFALAVLGLNRFKIQDRLNIDKYTMGLLENKDGLTEDYWPLYAIAGGVGALLGWTWLLLLGSRANQMMKFSVHILTTYLAVISVLCFWIKQYFWGTAFAAGAALQFLYVISVIERLPFTMLVLQRAVNMVWNLPEVSRLTCIFMLIMLFWLSLWSFGAAGVVALSIGDSGRWWLLLVGLAMVVVESAVTSIYICFAENPLLINRWDATFFNQMSERLHQRLQHRSARAREVLTHRIDDQIPELVLV